jgi:hypothetical protein
MMGEQLARIMHPVVDTLRSGHVGEEFMLQTEETIGSSGGIVTK